MKDKPGYIALRRGRWSEAQRIYLLTTVTSLREPLFGGWNPGCLMARCLADAGLWQPSHLLCWVLMPDHWHGLVALGDGQSLSTLMNRVKGFSARTFNNGISRRGRVWSGGFHDHAMRREEGLLPAARYIVANPVRAGLVGRVGDYPFWDACWL